MKTVKGFIIPMLVWCCFLPSISLAWNMALHVTITDMALQQLATSTQQRINQRCLHVFNRLSTQEKHELGRTFKHEPCLARLSGLPDRWKKESFAAIFRRFQVKLPPSLHAYAQMPTAGLHFINQPYPSSTHCSITQPHNVVSAIIDLQYAYTQATNPTTKALLLIFLTHFIEDAHQPLHTMSHVSRYCWSDHGGNGVCLKQRANGHCLMTLHQYWDSALGMAHGHGQVAVWASIITSQTGRSLSLLRQQAKDLNPHHWVRKQLAYAPMIYRIMPNHWPSKAYTKAGRAIAQYQLHLAALRLAAILQSLVAGRAHIPESA